LEFFALRAGCLCSLSIEGHPLMNQMELVFEQVNLIVKPTTSL
jgi:hypothetical protein